MLQNFKLLHNSLQRALADSENIISNMRSHIDIVNSGATAAEDVNQWMKTANSENADEADCLELVMVDNNGIQDFLMQRANTQQRDNSFKEIDE